MAKYLLNLLEDRMWLFDHDDYTRGFILDYMIAQQNDEGIIY